MPSTSQNLQPFTGNCDVSSECKILEWDDEPKRKKLSWECYEAALNFEDYHFMLTQFTAVFLSNTTSDGDLTPPILPGGKNSRSSPAFKAFGKGTLFYHGNKRNKEYAKNRKVK